MNFLISFQFGYSDITFDVVWDDFVVFWSCCFNENFLSTKKKKPFKKNSRVGSSQCESMNNIPFLSGYLDENSVKEERRFFNAHLMGPMLV